MRGSVDESMVVDRLQLVDRLHILRSGDIDIDPICRTLRRDNSVINGTPKVCRLIFHLAQHCGRAISKEELVQVIWPGVTVGGTSLRWLLKEARRCIGDDGTSPKYIETVRSYGLRWASGVTVVACSRLPRTRPASVVTSRGRVSRELMNSREVGEEGPAFQISRAGGRSSSERL